MAVITKILTKPFYYFFFGLLIAFFFLSFDKNFANIFTMFLAVSGFAYLFSKTGKNFLKYDINTASGNTAKAFTHGLLALAIFLAVSFFTVKILQPTGFLGLQSVLDRIAQTSLGATPILSGNQFVILLVGGLLIPIIETELFFITLPQVLASVFSVPLSIGSPSTWVLMLVVSGIFTFYHIEAKAITDNVAWALTFMFGVFQSWLVLKFREGESAIWMHVQNNFLGIAARFLPRAVGL